MIEKLNLILYHVTFSHINVIFNLKCLLIICVVCLKYLVMQEVIKFHINQIDQEVELNWVNKSTKICLSYDQFLKYKNFEKYKIFLFYNQQISVYLKILPSYYSFNNLIFYLNIFYQGIVGIDNIAENLSALIIIFIKNFPFKIKKNWFLCKILNTWKN